MKRTLLLLLIFPLAVFGVDIDSGSGLIKNPGWQLVRIHCGGCHSHSVVTGQRGDRETWLGMIRWMQGTQNLWQFTAETEMQILDYLAQSYPPQASWRRAPIPPELMPEVADID